MLSDIFPTGWHATELAGLKPGESVAIYGAGPVGLMAAHSAIIKGASQVFVVDTHTDRLALAEKMGATGINATGDEAVKNSRPDGWTRYGLWLRMCWLSVL
jgi:threonine dehydrogenase-like Zn-dependent dehydrogenase